MQYIKTEIEQRFTYHTVEPGQSEACATIREKAKELAYLIDELCPKSREHSSALTKLEETVFWTIKGIARHGMTDHNQTAEQAADTVSDKFSRMTAE